MRIKNIGLVIILIATSLGSCKKFLDVNTDKTFPQEVSPEVLIAPITFRMAEGLSFDNRTVNKYIQYFVGSSDNVEGSLYWERHGHNQPQENVGERMWRTVYFDLGKNLEEMIRLGKEDGKTEFVGIGYAIKAWAYQMLTDLHGPIVLDQAFEENRLSFAYQDQPEVYAKVRQWCDSALKYLNAKPIQSSAKHLASYSGDNIYGGDLIKWTKFTHAIRAIQYSRLINKPAFKTSYADSVLKYTDLSFANLNDDARVRFRASSEATSNVWGTEISRLRNTQFMHAGTPILKYLTGGIHGEFKADTTSSTDPRLMRMLVRTFSDSVFRAATPGAGAANASIPAMVGRMDNNEYLGKFIFKNNASFPIITHAQMLFIRSEAAFYKGDMDVAYDCYRRGIIASMDFVNSYLSATGMGDEARISEPEALAYVSSSEVVQSTDKLSLGIKDIMLQKYIALWPWGSIETWSDMRKYQYDLSIYKHFHPVNLLHGEYAYRLKPRYYSEYNWNRKELEKWGGLEPNYGTKKVWFVTPDN
ncbi:SusD/RagB family nutrient-binding outer membrane lipoprotein [Sphingobacterium tabacisoli]|uniref:SusD/RagB family nutrient-binding outer membrane lipoprotein n=1 Tax=Sphingobacterium tabacisoli TaxID=2044855 RepID=A0ABW5L3C3_9SPHI|nr:SusD/RagB family nutrient-binding outer membrane lipoprotein [Sphingobacterium tabacisoli]